MGRTGKVWGYQNFDVEPDVVTCAKVSKRDTFQNLDGCSAALAVCSPDVVWKKFAPEAFIETIALSIRWWPPKDRLGEPRDRFVIRSSEELDRCCAAAA